MALFQAHRLRDDELEVEPSRLRAILRGGLVVEEVAAFDSDEALVVARDRRPDLAVPRVAFLSRDHTTL